MHTCLSNRCGTVCRWTNAGVATALAVWFLLLPAAITVYFLNDPNLQTADTPRAAFWIHKNLSPRYEAWARERIESGRAAELVTTDLVQTEWPVFGSMFFLWATESLQETWERNPHSAPEAPMSYAAGAVEAATALILDPNHAEWVRQHWGDDHLHHDNCFYRMLTIGAMTVHARLTGSGVHRARLTQAVDELAADLDASPHGLLEDYPQECYPSDVVAAVACIRRADAVLGTDHSAFAARALRGFEGAALDITGLPPYLADVRRGTPAGPARGCSNSYQSLLAPEVWPEAAAEWYARYERYFWEAGPFTAGFREYPNTIPGVEWECQDMDAGPIVAGLGVSASAFGVGAARANGRFDHAYPLTAQMLAASWPLPDGTLLLPRVLSDAIDAPLLGEACILYNLSRRPIPTAGHRFGGYLPLLVPCFAGFMLAGAALAFAGAYGLVRRRPAAAYPWPMAQFAVWGTLTAGGVALLVAHFTLAGVVALLLAQVLPRQRPGALMWLAARLTRFGRGPAARLEGKWLH